MGGVEGSTEDGQIISRGAVPSLQVPGCVWDLAGKSLVCTALSGDVVT